MIKKMDNTSFWFHLGFVIGSLSREDLAKYLAENGFSMEDQKEINKQLTKLASIVFK
jgi:hypothetical protein